MSNGPFVCPPFIVFQKTFCTRAFRAIFSSSNFENHQGDGWSFSKLLFEMERMHNTMCQEVEQSSKFFKKGDKLGPSSISAARGIFLS